MAITACEASCSSTEPYRTTAKATPATYFSAPSPGCTSSTAGASTRAISPATMNQVEEIRTSLPAMVPTLNVPAGRDAGRVGALPGVRSGCSATPRRYPTARGPAVAGHAGLSAASPSLRVVEQLPVSPADRHSTPVDGVEVLGALSPSRAGDFLTCPLRYRFRTVDRLPEPLSPDAVRGTLVHKVLEDLFELPAAERTPQRAQALLEPTWEELCCGRARAARAVRRRGARGGAVAGVVPQPCWSATSPWRTRAASSPRIASSTSRTLLDSRLLLRGFIDRVDVAPDGAIRLVDYKTGRAPGPGYEAKALFQMKFYALVIWRTRGVVPAMLRLIYLGSGEIVSYAPDEDDLRATERKVEAVWRAIQEAGETGDWRPHRSRLCDWCAHQAICPAYGGTPPPLPATAPVLLPLEPVQLSSE